MEDTEQPKPRTSATAHEAATRRAAALRRTERWRDQSHLWPPRPLGQEIPERVKPKPGPAQLIAFGICKLLLGILCGLVLVWVIFCFTIAVSPPYSQYKQQSHQSHLLVSVAFLIVSAILFAVLSLLMSRKEKFFTLGLSFVGMVWVSILLMWTKG